MPERTALPTVPCVFCSLVVAIVDFSWCCIPNMTTGTGWYCWLSQFFNQQLERLIKISLAAENICCCRRLALRFKIIRSIVIWPNVCGRLGTKKTWQLELVSMLTPHQLWTTKLRRARLLKDHGWTFLYQSSLLKLISSFGHFVDHLWVSPFWERELSINIIRYLPSCIDISEVINILEQVH